MLFWLIPLFLLYPPSLLVYLCWKEFIMNDADVGVWDAFSKSTPTGEEAQAINCFEELYAYRSFHGLPVGVLRLAVAIGTGIGLCLMAYVFMAAVRPAWAFLGAGTLREVLWWGFCPLISLPLLVLAGDWKTRFPGKSWESAQKQILRRHFPDNLVLEQLRDSLFEGEIPRVSSFFFPHQKRAAGKLLVKLAILLGATAVAVLYGERGGLMDGFAAVLAFVAIFAQAFVSLALMRCFWDWGTHPKIPVATILVNAHEILGLKKREVSVPTP